ncbi:MAG: ComEA family DNA-binding protein [Bacteroidia bacterium]
MINSISKYFSLNRRERNGMLVLITLIFILVLIKYFVIYHYNPSTRKVVLVELDETAAKLVMQNMLSPNENSNNNFAGTAKKDSLFYFDPNKVSEEQAVKLGWSAKAARTFMNYRNKGGKFRKAEDLQKLYGMTDALYARLKPYVLIANETKGENSTQQTFVKKQEEKITLEINSADSLQWLKLKGIGPGFTHRILKYKSLLGGYTNTEQLKEVYYFTDSLYNLIKDNLTVNPALVQKLKVNQVDFKTMVHHPYIKYEGTKCIFALKRGKKIKAEDLNNSSCFSREVLAKLMPYLDFE